jgi:hypothetical protein
MAETTAVVEKKEETAVQHINKVTDFSLGIFGTSDNFTMAYQMAKALSQSTLVPREYQKSEANCMIAIDLAIRMKTSPFLVMQNLDVIQGKPGWNAKALIGMINTSHKYDGSLHFEEKADKNGKPFSCMCYAFENGERIDGPVVDMDMAVAEGWVGKNGSKWKTMPQVMLAYRAASFFSRRYCPEISMGLYTSDEIIDGDFTDKSYSVENMQEEVTREISDNANSVEFKEDVDTTAAEATEEQADSTLPPFMQAE